MRSSSNEGSLKLNGGFLWNKRLVSPIKVTKPEETPDATYKPRSNPKQNVVVGIYEKHQEVLTLPVSVVITGILQPMHALRGFISPVLYWPILL